MSVLLFLLLTFLRLVIVAILSLLLWEGMQGVLNFRGQKGFWSVAMAWAFVWVPITALMLAAFERTARMKWWFLNMTIHMGWMGQQVVAVAVEPFIEALLIQLPLLLLFAGSRNVQRNVTVSKAASLGLFAGEGIEFLESIYDVAFPGPGGEVFRYKPLISHWFQYLSLGIRPLQCVSGGQASFYSLGMSMAFVFAITAWGFRRGGKFQWLWIGGWLLNGFEHSFSNYIISRSFFGVCTGIPNSTFKPLVFLWHIDGHGALSMVLLIALLLAPPSGNISQVIVSRWRSIRANRSGHG